VVFDRAVRPLRSPITVANLAAFWQQMLPTMPVLPVLPTNKYFTVNNLWVEPYHGMEELIGSIPIRSTNQTNNLANRQERATPRVWLVSYPCLRYQEFRSTLRFAKPRGPEDRSLDRFDLQKYIGRNQCQLKKHHL
jgi:hypothetical protein